MTEEAPSFVSNEDLSFSGRKANTNLGNFRLLGKSKHQQYYTPNELAETIFEMLQPALQKENNLENYSVLDPTCGSGRLLLPWKKAKAQVIGIELDKESAIVAKRLLGKDNIRVGDILDYSNHLENFNFAISNPPYGIFWQSKEKGLSFECECYGGTIESQSATIEIITKALNYSGILVSIIPTTTFTNTKDKKLRNHIYENYNLLLRATLNNLFKEEYGINVQVDLLVAQRNNWEQQKPEPEKIEIDFEKDFNWRNTLVKLMHSIMQEREIQLYPSGKNHVPFLNAIQIIPITKTISVTPKGTKGEASAIAILDFNNQVINEYNPIQGIETGITEAYLSPATLVRRGLQPGKNILERMGFEVQVSENDSKKIESLKEKYDFLCTPLCKPKPHQLLAYFYDQEYEAKATVKNEEGILFIKGKNYRLRPTWVRRKELVNIQEAYDERKKENVVIRTDVDRGYLSIRALTEQGEKVFGEIDVNEIKLFTEAFELPVIEDVADRYPSLVEANRKRIQKETPFLFDYQKEDIARLALKNFGYIGYEMGGGKTVAAASWAKLRGYKQVLVVCQSGLVNNWMNELKKFGFKAHSLTTHSTITHLAERKRTKQRNKDTVFYVTSYEFLSLDTARVYDPWDCVEYDKDGNVWRSSEGNTSHKCPKCQKDFSTVIRACPKCKSSDAWTGNSCLSCGYCAYTYAPRRKSYPAYKRLRKLFSAVIVDEAQLAKSKNTGRGRAVRALKCKGKLILTGTLMKGYITDVYWNVGWILGYDNPLFHYKYRGGSKQFLNEFGTFEYVTKQFEETLSEGRGKLIPEVSNLNRFWRILSAFTIRRLKDEMIELPEKHKNIILLPMDTEHQILYTRYQEWAASVIQDAFNKANQNDGEVNMGIISSALWKLRFAATVPNAKQYLCSGAGPNIALSNGASWNKLRKVIELLTEIKQRREKAIIFSGLRPMVSSIITALKNRGISFIPILACNKTNQRFEMIEKFSHDESITAIVAGLNVLNRGFTITAANHVIITDIEYTPESILQAEDRAHRTGQQKEVNVYYLFSSSSIDDVMFELVSKKQSAISSAIDAKAVHKDVAHLLESMRGNIQLEIAKKIVEITPERKPQIIEMAIEQPRAIPQAVYDDSRKEQFDKLLKQKIELEKERATRKKTEIVDSRQLGLFS